MAESTVCHCGHLRVWHGGTNSVGGCDFTGPQPTDGCECPSFRPKASPYVQVHLTRKQAQLAYVSLVKASVGTAKTNPIRAVIRQVEAALNEHTGVAS